MILNPWSEDQEGIVKIFGGGREGVLNIHQCCMYLALTACVLYTYFYFKEDHFEWHIVVRGID